MELIREHRRFSRELFDRAYGLIVEAACPLDGSPLNRRPDYGYAFCATCGKGWMARAGDMRVISSYPDWLVVSDSGGAVVVRRMLRDGSTFTEHVPLPSWLVSEDNQ